MKPDRSCAIKTGHFNVLTTADSNRTQAAAGHVALIPSGFVRMKPFTETWSPLPADLCSPKAINHQPYF